MEGRFWRLFAAVKAIALNLLSVSVSFRALVLVFEDVHGSSFLGVHEGTVSVFPHSDGWGLAGEGVRRKAAGFLLKPLSDTVLLSSVQAALRTT